VGNGGPLRLLGALLLASFAADTGRAEAAPPPIAASPYRAQLNYRLHCSGCHKDDGSGQPGFVPPLKGQVGRYLWSEDGRAFLMQVPGVAQSLLNDQDLADVLNYTVRAFDGAGAPPRARRFEAAEVGRLRKRPLTDTDSVRRRVLAAAPNTSR
jgi:mono/diheme cytochrome c family protein